MTSISEVFLDAEIWRMAFFWVTHKIPHTVQSNSPCQRWHQQGSQGLKDSVFDGVKEQEAG